MLVLLPVVVVAERQNPEGRELLWGPAGAAVGVRLVWEARAAARAAVAVAAGPAAWAVGADLRAQVQSGPGR